MSGTRLYTIGGLDRWTAWTNGLDYWTHLFTKKIDEMQYFWLLSNPDGCKHRPHGPINVHRAHNWAAVGVVKGRSVRYHYWNSLTTTQVRSSPLWRKMGKAPHLSPRLVAYIGTLHKIKAATLLYLGLSLYGQLSCQLIEVNTSESMHREWMRCPEIMRCNNIWKEAPYLIKFCSTTAAYRQCNLSMKPLLYIKLYIYLCN